MSEYSCGQQLLHNYRLKQGACIKAEALEQQTRETWSNYYAKAKYRGNTQKLKNSALLLVLSQDCDIACRNDEQDSAVELVVCKRIRKKDIYEGNQFVHSVRKLHFEYQQQWYEANVEYLLMIEKADLLSAFVCDGCSIELGYLIDEYAKSLPLWRANRYNRTALPDKFNAQLLPLVNKEMKEIAAIAAAGEEQIFSSFIRAIYIRVEPLEESEHYQFELFALLADEVDDQQLSRIQDSIETLAEALSENSGYEDISQIYADRQNNTTVAFLASLLRFNLDYYSLSHNDNDTGIDL